MTGVWVALLASAVLSEDRVAQDPLPAPPPWLGVHLLNPPSLQAGEYDCAAGMVKIEIASFGYYDRSPEVRAINVGHRKISAADLDRWNRWLKELAIYRSFSVACRGDWVGVGLHGSRRGDGAEHSISIMWRDGEIWRTPLGADDWRRAMQEGWFPPYEPIPLTKEN